jgi:DNA-binding transcriptional LysR family regulator
MIDRLEFLLALAREKHFGRAAEVCGVTQPTLSACVKHLEESLGVLLVHRGSRFRAFTPEGERVLDWARRIVGDNRAMRQEIATLRHGLAGHLTIGVIPSATTIVADITTPYRQRHPNVRFTVLSRSSVEILADLENLDLDAGITYLDNEPLGRVNAVPVYDERYVLIAARDSPFAGRERVTWAEVGAMPLCLLTPDMQNRRIIDGLLLAAGTQPKASLESNSVLALITHVRKGDWASVVPEKLVQNLRLAEQLLVVPIGEPIVAHRVGLVVPEREPMTPLLVTLIAQAKQASAGLRTE